MPGPCLPPRAPSLGVLRKLAGPRGAAGPKPRSVALGTRLYLQRPCRVGPQLGLGAGGRAPDGREAEGHCTAWLAGLRSSPLTGEGADSETEALRGLGPWRACPLSQLILRAFPAIPGPQQAFQKLRHVRTFMSHSNLTQNSSFLPWN